MKWLSSFGCLPCGWIRTSSDVVLSPFHDSLIIPLDHDDWTIKENEKKLETNFTLKKLKYSFFLSFSFCLNVGVIHQPFWNLLSFVSPVNWYKIYYAPYFVSQIDFDFHKIMGIISLSQFWSQIAKILKLLCWWRNESFLPRSWLPCVPKNGHIFQLNLCDTKIINK